MVTTLLAATALVGRDRTPTVLRDFVHVLLEAGIHLWAVRIIAAAECDRIAGAVGLQIFVAAL